MAPSFSRHLVLAALAAGVLRAAPIAADVQVDDGTWRVLPPFTRTSHGAAYDPTGHRVFVFGGTDRGGGRNDLWALVLGSAPAWTRVSPGGSPPSAGPARLIHDPVRNRLLAFNGTNTWELPLDGPLLWGLLPVAGAPPGRLGSATYDPVRDRMLVFGGSTAAATNQVHELSLSGAPTWSVVSTAGTPPAPRDGHQTVYDTVRDRLLVVMGFTAGGGTSEVWELSLSEPPTWTPMSPAGAPGSRASHTAIYDPPRDRLVMFAGFLSTGSYTTEEWELSLSGTPTWTLLSPSGTPPGARAGHVAVYDPIGDRMLVHAGRRSPLGTAVYWDDLWEQPLSGPPSWSLVIPGGVSVGLREAPVVVEDPSRDRVFLFGGCAPSFTGTDMSCSALGDVLTLDLAANAWTQVVPAGTAPPPGGGRGVYDGPRDRMLLWRGGSAIWELAFSGTPTWTELSTSGSAPAGYETVHDPLRERMLVFGPDVSGMRVWALSLSTLTWSDVTTAGTPPPFRDRCGIVYDTAHDQVLLFGGAGGSPTGFLNEVVALSLAGTPTWVPLDPTGTPPEGRWFPFVVYDSARDRMVVFSGRTANATSAGYPTDTWALTLSGPAAWSALTPAGGPPRGRENGAAIYDEVRDRMLVWVGMRNHPLESIIPINDSWELSWNTTVGVPPSGTPATLSMGIPRPNPAQRSVAVPFISARAASWETRAYDVAGRRVMSRRIGRLEPGRHAVEWDLRAHDGSRLGPGLYFLEIAGSNGERARQRVVVLR